MDLSKKVFGANVSKEIQDYFRDLQEGNFEIRPGDSISKTSDKKNYLGDRTPYARMWVAVNVREEISGEEEGPSLPGGGRGFGKTYIYSINENRKGSYNPNELDSLSLEMRNIIESGFGFNTNYRPQLDNNPYLKPTAGIISIDSKSEGAVGALRRTNVNFVVHNKQDFNSIFLPFFLKPGATVFVDFGWSDKDMSLYKPESQIDSENPSMNDFYKKIYESDSDSSKGLKTTLSGQVTKYDVNVDEKGSFNCSLEFVSPNYALLDKSVSDDNDLKFIFENNIEDILMKYYLRFAGLTSFETFDDKSKVLNIEDRKKLINDFFDTESTPDINDRGIIDTLSLKSGLFYQNLTERNGEEDQLDDKESLYISYGLFEDLFLNNFISFWVSDDSEQKIKSDEPFSNSFSSKNSYVRWDDNLFNMQKEPFRNVDERASFLYPSTWDDTYNKNPQFKPSNWKNTDDDKSKRRLPLRDLFISVPLIIEAFKKSNIVNDALEFIFDSISEDSATIINIKMISNNDAQSSITFQDVNVEADKFTFTQEKILTFDLTGGNTIVLNSDLKFETPKAGLSSMIAIGGIDSDDLFDELELIKFNFLNALSTSDRKFRVNHLPIYGKTPSKRKSLDIDMKRFIENVKLNPQTETNNDLIKNENDTLIHDYRAFIKARTKAIEAYSDSINPNIDSLIELSTLERPDKTPNGNPIIYATSERDASLINAKIENFMITSENSISPIMPITLSLKIYGNNFLGIGDFFTVNFLPTHYQERVYFQIVGVDHNLGTSMWDTTYTTVMRLKSTEKYRTSNNANSEKKRPVVKYDGEFVKLKVGETHSTNDRIKNTLIDLLTIDIEKRGVVKSKTLFNIPTGLSDKDFPHLNITFERHTLNSSINKLEIDNLLKDKSKSRFMSKEKIITNVNHPNSYSEGTLTYLMVISNLLLSDDVIDWAKVAEDTLNPPKFFRPLTNRPDQGTVVSNTIKDYVSNGVHVRSKSNSQSEAHGEDVGADYKVLLEHWDNIDWFTWNDFGLLTLDENEKIIDDIVKSTKQNLSTSIQDVMNYFRGFHFIDGIVWPMVENQNNFFININIKGNTDVDIFNNIYIPEKYLKKEILSDSQAFVEKIRRNYVELKLKFYPNAGALDKLLLNN